MEVLSESNNRLHLSVNAKEDSFLVVNDTHFPGWKARVDGDGEKIYRANYAFRALPIAAGSHEVCFIFDPISFKLGATITLLGAIVCLVTGLLIQRKRGLNERALEKDGSQV